MIAAKSYCAVCRYSFIPTRRNGQKFCSTKCRNADWGAKKRAARAFVRMEPRGNA